MNIVSRSALALIISAFALGCAESTYAFVPMVLPAPTTDGSNREAIAGGDAESAEDEAAGPSNTTTGSPTSPTPEATATIEEAGAVGIPFNLRLNLGDDPTGTQTDCGSDLCQVGLFTLHPDGTYTWRSYVGTLGWMEEARVACDSGQWRQRDDEIVLVSCSGDSYQADWQVEASDRFRIGDYSLKVSASNGVWSAPCDSSCEPFYSQSRQ